MDKDEPTIKKTRKPIKVSLKSFHFSLGADADTDWKFLSMIFFLLAVLSTVFNAFFFAKFVIWSEKGSAKQAQVELIDREKLLNIIESYKERNARFAEIMSASKPAIDQPKKADIVVE